MNAAPRFRFYPAAYDAKKGRFEASQEKCDICEAACVWRYTGPIYMIGASPTVCARCLYAGRIGTFLSDRDDAETRALKTKHPDWDVTRYSLHDVELEEDVSDNALEELMQRTPSVASFNPFDWPVHNALPMAWIGVGTEPELVANPDIWRTMQTEWASLWPDDPLTGPTEYLLIFQSIDASAYRAVVDLD